MKKDRRKIENFCCDEDEKMVKLLVVSFRNC